MMKIEHLLQFARLSSYRSLNQASQDLFISHQGLSKMVAALEKECDTTLFIRQTDGITLTADGEYLYQTATEVAQILGTLENALSQRVHRPLSGEITIFSDDFAHAKYLTKLLPTLHSRYPQLAFRLTIIENARYTARAWSDDYEIFLQAAENDDNVIGLFTFLEAPDQPMIAYPTLTVYRFHDSELLLGHDPNGLKVHSSIENYHPHPILILNERDFGQNNAITQHLAQDFELIPVRSQLQCVRALSTVNTYTIESAEDTIFFPPAIRFAPCTPPLKCLTYYMFSDRSAQIARQLYATMLDLLANDTRSERL